MQKDKKMVRECHRFKPQDAIVRFWSLKKLSDQTSGGLGRDRSVSARDRKVTFKKAKNLQSNKTEAQV